MPTNIRKRTRKAYSGGTVRVVDRPWSALTASQREQRLDMLGAWHERDIFKLEIIKHVDKRVRDRAERSTEKEMQLLVRAHKQGIDLTAVSIEKLAKTANWSTLRQAQDLKPEAAPLAAPPLGGKFANLDALIAKAAGGPLRQVREQPAEVPRTATREKAEEKIEEPAEKATEYINEDQPQPGEEPAQEPAREPRLEGLRHAATQSAASAFQAIPEPGDDAAADAAAAEAAAKAAAADKAEIELIRSKLVVNGKVRLDLEAIAIYLLCPSYFAIATGLDPEAWQSRLLDSYALRLGCLASRQCGKSIVVARKVTAFALANPGTTTLILAPTLRQSSELLLKISGTVQLAGLRIATLNQFQLVLQDKQPGALSRIVCLPGSNEDSGASTRGYAADLLVLEEAAFLSDVVISSVLPSIAARPKAQLIGISSAGIIGTFFHSVMTSAQSRWTKMVVPASKSGRFSPQQLQELKLNLGARYGVEMECKWSSIGDSIYDEGTMDTAFGTNSMNAPQVAEPDLDAAFAHLDLDDLFSAQPFPRRAA